MLIIGKGVKHNNRFLYSAKNVSKTGRCGCAESFRLQVADIVLCTFIKLFKLNVGLFSTVFDGKKPFCPVNAFLPFKEAENHGRQQDRVNRWDDETSKEIKAKTLYNLNQRLFSTVWINSGCFRYLNVSNQTKIIQS
jgi:hypothetical protein